MPAVTARALALLLAVFLTPAAAAPEWCLIRPPLSPVGDVVAIDAPIREWERVGVYETASACEEARSELLRTFGPLTTDEKKALSPRQTGLVVVAELIAAGSRCVASDDPRLR
jgi:hypothetical protein